jgi:hypothetical protein
MKQRRHRSTLSYSRQKLEVSGRLPARPLYHQGKSYTYLISWTKWGDEKKRPCIRQEMIRGHSARIQSLYRLNSAASFDITSCKISNLGFPSKGQGFSRSSTVFFLHLKWGIRSVGFVFRRLVPVNLNCRCRYGVMNFGVRNLRRMFRVSLPS